MSVNLTLLFEIIAFLAFIYTFKRFLWKPIIDALANREKTIADGLAAAAKGQKDRAEAEQRAEEALRTALAMGADDAVRVTAPGVINVFLKLTTDVCLAAAPRSGTDRLVRLVRDTWPAVEPADSVFQTTLQNGNPVIHPAVTLLNAGVLEKELLAQLKEPLRKIKPMTAVFDQSYVKRLSGTNVKTGKTKFDLAQQRIDEIVEWKKTNKCARLEMIWAASTEVFLNQHAVHANLE